MSSSHWPIYNKLYPGVKATTKQHGEGACMGILQILCISIYIDLKIAEPLVAGLAGWLAGGGAGTTLVQVRM